ncbi:thiamine pyrophosphate-binding protein [Burkholderia cenocepacia]|nr:thiamine pyrophosphate-binding protein [Burkholderia cenocepacia]
MDRDIPLYRGLTFDMKRYFSDLIVDFLKQQEIEYVAFNPGASFRGIHDSLVHREDSPEILMACHEEIAVAMAHGYYKACNRHMAVFLHANVGLLHGSMAIFNAWCDRVPLLLIGGNGPIDAAKRRPWIDWIHTSQNIESAVKDFVKWCDQPTSQRATVESLYRAFKLMNTEMHAPCYVAIDFDVQEQEVESAAQLLPPTATTPSRLPAADAPFIENLTERLLSARMPVLIIDFSGRDPATVAPLISLAEQVGMAVIDRGNRFNFPNVHPLNVSNAPPDMLKEADLVLAIEVQDLAGALGAFLPVTDGMLAIEDVTVVTLSTSDTLPSKWAADYQQFVPVNLGAIADTRTTVEALERAVADAADRHARPEREERVRALTVHHERVRREWDLDVRQLRAEDNEIHVATAVREIFQVVQDRDWILTNTGSLTIDGWVKKLWDIERPGSYLGLNGGAGLGYGLGASIGAAIAHRNDDVLCIDLQADGDFLYTPSALWTLSSYDVPLLVIIMNNRLYLNSTQHAERIAKARNRVEDLSHVATSFFETPVDFVKIAEGFGIKSFPRIDRASEIEQIVGEAAHYVVTQRKPALVEILMK